MAKPFNVNVIFATLVLLFGNQLQTGYNIGVLNLLQDFVKKFFRDVQDNRDPVNPLTESESSTLFQIESSIMLVGIVVGALLAGRCE